MRVTREPSGYGMLGLSWCTNPFGRTLILGAGKWRLSLHRRRDVDALLRQARTIRPSLVDPKQDRA